MKKCLLLKSLILIFFHLTYAQNEITNYLEVNAIYHLSEFSYNKNNICTYFDSVFCGIQYNSTTTKDTIFFIRMNVFTKEKNYDTIIIKNLSTYFNSRKNIIGFHKILMQSNKIILTTYGFMLYFSVDANKIKYEKMQKHDISSSCFSLINEKQIILAKIYNAASPPTYLGIFNIEKGEIEQFIEPENYHTIFSYNADSKLIDVNSDIIVWCDRNRYGITFYDADNLQKVATIERNIPEWVYFNEKQVNKILKKYSKYDAMDIINATAPILNNSYQMRAVHLISSEKLMVVYRNNNQDYTSDSLVFIDIWEKKDDEWILTKKDIKDCLKLKEINGILTTKSIALGILYGGDIFFENQYIIELCYHFGTLCHPIGKTKKEYSNCVEEYYLNNDPIMEIRVFKHNF